MAYDTNNLVGRVQRRIKDTGYPSSEVIDALNDTQNDIYNEYRLPFMEARAHTEIDEGELINIADGLVLPSDYVQAIDLTLTTDGQERLLDYKDASQIDVLYPDPDDPAAHTTSTPQYWYLYANLIRFFPVPNTISTMSLRYYKKPTDLVNGTDVPSIPSESSELLVVGAAYRIMQTKDNYDQAGVLENKYDELLQKFIVRWSQPQVGTPMIMRINRRALGKAHF